MKYINYKTKDNENHIGILEDEIIYRLDYTNIIQAIHDEDNIKERYTDSLIDNLNDVTILLPTEASKIVCVGLNYKDHAEEFNMEIPEEPLLFMKPSTSLTAHNTYINYPEESQVLDLEAELGIVILDKISRNNNTDYKVAYTIVNDVTARDLQEKDGQWTRSKSFDTFCPVGPVVITSIDVGNLRIYSKVNDKVIQDSNTENMIFSSQELVKYISNIMTLNPGDIIATGTPPGVDHLQKGDVVEITIEDIGTLCNIIR